MRVLISGGGSGGHVFAALQGLAALVTGGMVPSEGLEDIVDGAVAQLLRGLRPR